MKLSTAHKIGRFFQYFVLILVGVIMISPLVWMVGATSSPTPRSSPASAS